MVCATQAEPSWGFAGFAQQRFPLPSEEYGRATEERFALGCAAAACQHPGTKH